MAITATYTQLRVNTFGDLTAIDFKVVLAGSGGANTNWPASVPFGLANICFIEVMPDGSGANTHGSLLWAPNISGTAFGNFGTGASSTNPFLALSGSQAVGGTQFIIRVYGTP